MKIITVKSVSRGTQLRCVIVEVERAEVEPRDVVLAVERTEEESRDVAAVRVVHVEEGER